MGQRRIFQHERVDDIPLIIGLANKLHVAEVLDHHMGTHRLQQGVNNGQLAVGWLADILSQADHRTSAVRDWANGLPHTLAHLLGHPIRAVECRDDRLGVVVHRLSNDETWDAIEHDLWATTVPASAFALTGIRLDRTTSSGDHQVTEDGVRQRGHSTDHRPALPQRKLMAAAAEPSGHLIACDVHAGQCADAPLSTPLLQRVRGIVGPSGLWSAGDGTMAARATRAESAAHHAFSLMPLPLTGETAMQVETWGTAIVDGAQEATLLWDGEHWLGAGDEWARPLQALVDGQLLGWTARVQVVRSPTLAQRHQAPWRSVWPLRKRRGGR
jgi:transposase